VSVQIRDISWDIHDFTLLLNLGIVREIDASDTVEYTLNEGAEVVRLLYRLEGVINNQLNP
jgi:hypothetical protein